MASVRMNQQGIDSLLDHVDSRIYSKAMGPMERDAKRYAPVDTGWLRWNIRAKHKRRWSYELRATTVGRTVGSDQYAVYVELGTRFTRAQPYLRPAAMQGRSLA